MKKGTALITGGAGFIGSHTADTLSERGYRVRILDNLEPIVHRGKWPKYILGKGYELIRGDVRRKSDWIRALRGVSYVYHLAAYQDQRSDFSKFFHVNTVGTSLLYEVVVGNKLPLKKIILASSQFVYGDGKYGCRHNKKLFYPGLRSLSDLKDGKFDIRCSHNSLATFTPFYEDQPVNPTNSYGLSKYALENLSLKFGKTYKIPTTVLRYSIVQGPRQSPYNLYSGALRIFTVQALDNKPITVYEDGMQTRDFVNINDVVSANLVVLKNKKSDYGVFNVGGGKAHGVLDFAELVKKVTGSRSRIITGGFRRTDTRHAVSDISKLKKLGWKPKFSIEKSIKDYMDWYKKEFL